MTTYSALTWICVTFPINFLHSLIFWLFLTVVEAKLVKVEWNFYFQQWENRLLYWKLFFSFNFNEKIKRGQQIWIFCEVLLKMKGTFLTWPQTQCCLNKNNFKLRFNQVKLLPPVSFIILTTYNLIFFIFLRHIHF